jgi:hypothetical protein
MHGKWKLQVLDYEIDLWKIRFINFVLGVFVLTPLLFFGIWSFKVWTFCLDQCQLISFFP